MKTYDSWIAGTKGFEGAGDSDFPFEKGALNGRKRACNSWVVGFCGSSRVGDFSRCPNKIYILVVTAVSYH